MPVQNKPRHGGLHRVRFPIVELPTGIVVFEDLVMSEVTLMDSGLEVGTIDIPTDALVVGGVFDGMRFVSIEFAPATGEDAIVVIEYV